MNGDGGSDQNGVDGQDISPGSVTTGEVKTTDLTFTIARQADTLFSATNYVLPISKPPEDGSTYALCNSVDAGGLFVTPSVNSTFAINVATGANAQLLTVTFQPNATFSIDIVLSAINNAIARWYESVFAPVAVFLSLNVSSFPYRTNIFVNSAAANAEIRNAGGTQHQVATFLGWPATSPNYAGINTFTSPNTNTVTQIIEIDNLCIWKKIPTVYDGATNKISSYDGTTSITCQDVGAIQSFGNVNYNGGILSNVGSIAGMSVCNITTDTTQIVNGSSQIKLSVDNMINTANTTATFSPTDYTLSQKFGGFERTRHQINGTDQIFSSPSGVEKLRVNNSGVRINNLYTLPAVVGDAGAILTSNGAGLTTWEPAVIVNPFDQELNTFSDVSFNSVTTENVDTGGVLTLGGSLGTVRILGNTATPTSIRGISIDLNGPVSIASNYVLPITAGTSGQVLTKGAGVSSAWQTPQVSGLFSQTSIKTVENTLAETSLIGSGVGNLTVPIGFFQNGYSFVYKTGGQWRTVANNQSIRFRLRTNSFLFDTGILLTTNVNTVRGWNIECQFTYYAGTIVTNLTFTYIDANNNTSGFVSRGNGVINNAVSNTIDFTVQWGGIASISNTITSDYGTLTKIF